MTERKSTLIELKADGEPGEFRAVFATFDVIDAHGDVTLPDAFKAGAEVLIGAWNHDQRALPVGRGKLVSDAERAYIDGRFNLNTSAGRDTYEAAKDAGSLMEWSYVYRPTKHSYGEHDGKSVRFLEAIDVFSVDPVLKGAGVGTGTVAIKSAVTFADSAEALATALGEFGQRAKSRIEMRAKDGRSLSADDREQLKALGTALDELRPLLEEAPAEPVKSNPVDLQAEALRHEHHSHLARG